MTRPLLLSHLSPLPSAAALLYPSTLASLVPPQGLCWFRATNALSWAFAQLSLLVLSSNTHSPQRPVWAYEVHAHHSNVALLNCPICIFLVYCLFLHTRHTSSVRLSHHRFSISQMTIHKLKKVIFEIGLSADRYDPPRFYVKASLSFLLKH